MKECMFCKIIKGETRGEIVKTSNNFIALKDRSPVALGHTLVIPKKHYVTLLDIPVSLAQEFLIFTKEIAEELLETKKGDGFNLVMNNLPPAGQVVPHAHVHVIPRKEDDGIRFFHIVPHKNNDDM